MKDTRKSSMNRGSTIILRIVLFGMGAVGLLMCALFLRGVSREWNEVFAHVSYLRLPVLIGIAVAGIAYAVALYYAYILLGLIDANKSFSAQSVKTLQMIKYCAYTIAGVFALGMPAVFYVAERDDAPGLILFAGAIFIGAPVTVAVFAGVCQRLFQNAIDLKSENDLTA